MRSKSKVDENQSEIVRALRLIGCSVQTLHTVGEGCPDLLVGCNGFNLLVEVKDGNKPPSKRTLTPDQIIWHDAWRGQVQVIKSVDHALRMVNYYRKNMQAAPIPAEEP